MVFGKMLSLGTWGSDADAGGELEVAAKDIVRKEIFKKKPKKSRKPNHSKGKRQPQKNKPIKE